MFVLDASVAAKWFNNEIFTDKAIELRDSFAEGKVQLYAPKHLLYEVGNAIWKNRRLSTDDSRRAIVDILSMEIDLVRLDSNLASEAMKVARELDVSYYDALYIQLSNHLNIPLLSADGKLLLKAKKNNSLHLKDFHLEAKR